MRNEIHKNVEYLLKAEEGNSELLRRLEAEVGYSLEHDAPLTAMPWVGQVLEALQNYQGQSVVNNQLEEVTGRIAAEFAFWIVGTYGSIPQAQTPADLPKKQDQDEEYHFVEKFDNLQNWGVAKWAFFQSKIDFLSVFAKSSPASLTKVIQAFGQIYNCYDKLPSNRQEQALSACEALALAIRDAMESMVVDMKNRKGQ